MLIYLTSIDKRTLIFDSIGDNSAENMEKLRAAAKSAFVVGYTGETGKELVKAMANSKVFSKVTLIGRRKVEYDADMLKDFNVVSQVDLRCCRYS